MRLLGFFAFFACSVSLFAQTSDSVTIRRIYDLALTNGKSYAWLEKLCNEAPARLSGSKNAATAVLLTKKMLEDAGADSVWLQEVMVPHWERGTLERGTISGSGQPFHITALGGSPGTPSGGISANVIEVQSIDALKELGEEKVRGKIVFFNRPMNPKYIDTFESYGACAEHRLYGGDEASQLGAVGVIVRSLALREDDFPHTGTMIFRESKKIPGAAISTRDAEKLSDALKKNPGLRFELELSCKTYADALSHNVIGEIRGSRYPDEILLVGGHLDSWDNSEGAHDDGAGVMHSIEVIYLLKKLGIRPERTVRCVLFMNEENGSKGARKYAELSKSKGEKHLVAIESDRGGFVPRGFTVEGNDAVRRKCLETIRGWEHFFRPYLVHVFEYGGSGVDVSKLKDQNVALMGFIPDSQRYFDVHHSSDDRFVHVNKRELELGCATMASLIYLFSKYGFTAN